MRLFRDSESCYRLNYRSGCDLMTPSAIAKANDVAKMDNLSHLNSIFGFVLQIIKFLSSLKIQCNTIIF